MTKLRTVARGKFLWLVADVTQPDRIHRVWLHKQGRVGDCIRPGQKMKEA